MKRYILCSGSWNFNSFVCRLKNITFVSFDSRSYDLGFRLIKTTKL